MREESGAGPRGGGGPGPPGDAKSGPDENDGPKAEAAGDLPALHVRVARVFVSPGRLFDRLREQPVWLGALIVVVAAGLAWTWLVPEELLRQAILQQAPPDADPQMLDEMTRFARIGNAVAAAVGPFVVSTVVAGALFFVYNLVLGGDSTFRKLFSVTAHTLLIPAAGTLLTVPLVLATGDVETTLALHLLLPAAEEGYLYRLLHGLNVFGLWAAVVLGIGVSRLYPKRGAGSSAATLAVLYVGLKAGLALIGA